MRASVASLSKKLISTFFAATLALGLVPAAAFAADNDAADNVTSNTSSSVGAEHGPRDGEDPIEDNVQASDDANPATVIPVGEIINQEMSLRVIAQAESTRSYFLAQTLESTRTVPVVSANLPLDEGAANELIENDKGSGELGSIAEDSVVVGSFEQDGIVYALEPGGESVAIIAVDTPALSEGLDDSGVLTLSNEASLGIETYSVTRVAGGAFAGLSDIASVIVSASIMNIEDDAFAGLSSLQTIAVSSDNPVYSSYDDCLYTADLTSLLLIPEGRTGAVRIASNVTKIDPEVFSHCPSVDALLADANSAALTSWEGSLYDISGTDLLRVPPAVTNLTILDGCVTVVEGALEGCTKLESILSPASLMDVSPDVFGMQSDDEVASASNGAVDPSAIIAELPANAFRTPWEAVGITVEGGIEGYELRNNPSSGAEAESSEDEPSLLSMENRATSNAVGATLDIWSRGAGRKVGGSGYANNEHLQITNVHDWAAYGLNVSGAGSVQFHLNGSSNLYVITPSSGGSATFAGWMVVDGDGTTTRMLWSGSQTSGTSNATIGVIWSDMTAGVAFQTNGGSAPWFTCTQNYPNQKVGIGPTWRTGYTFAGWYYDAALTSSLPKDTDGSYYLIPPYGGPTIIYAKWTPNVYTITLNMNGGSWSNGTQFWEKYGTGFYSNSACTSAYGTVLGGTMTRANYTLEGFYTAATGGTKVMTGTTLPANTTFTSNTTLYAHWTPNIYTITLNMDGGSWSNGTQFWEKYATGFYSNSACTSAYGTTLGGTFTKQHYTLEGFYTAAKGGGTRVMTGTTLPSNTQFTSNTTLYANWAPNIYKISLNLDGGTWDLGRTAFWEKYGVGFGTTDTCANVYGATLSGNITKTGYTLDGFYTAANGGGTKVMTGITLPASYTYFTGNTTLYAKWTIKTSALTFNMNNGSGTAPTGKTATYGQVMPDYDKDEPSRIGYTFGGFYDTDASTGGNQYYTAALASAQSWNKDVTTPTTLYARWTPNHYAIGWNPQGGSVNTTGKTDQVYGNKLSLPPTPTQEGYSFAGWWTTSGEDPADPGTQVVEGTTMVPAFNATYFARWNKVSAKVTLKAAGGTFTQAQVDAFNSAAGDHPIAALNDDKNEIELPFDVDTKSFSLDLLKPTLTGSAFTGWNPAFTPPSWNSGSLSWNNAATYTATWSTNSYGVTYVDKGGNPLVGWSAEKDGPSLESALPQAFNEATPVSERALPEKPYKRGYTWVKWTWTHDGVEEEVTSIPNVSESVTIVANFTADPFPVTVDLVGGISEGWPEDPTTIDMTYNDPYLEMPATPKKGGYVFCYFEAYRTGSDEAVYVYERDDSGDYTVATTMLEPGKTYKVLGLGSGADAYDVSSVKAVWQVRIAIDVPSTVNLGIMADTAADTLRFRQNETIFAGGDTADDYAPVTFTSYTTAPVGIVKVTDDMTDDGAADRALLREEIFHGKQGLVKLALSASKALTHKLAFGGATDPVASDEYLSGLRIEKADGDTGNPTEAVFWLGMDFGGLKAADLISGKAGDIAKLYYTVALLDDDDKPIAESLGKLSAYDGNEVNW